MRPTILTIPLFGWDLAIPTYGLLLAGAFLAALWFATREARRDGLAPDAVLDLWIAALVSGIVGAKVLLYLLDLDYYIDNPKAILTGLRSAGVFYGGLVVAVVVCAVMAVRRGLSVGRVADIAAPAIALGQSIGRLGCFAAGCCWGRPTDLPWAVTFTDPEAHRITGVPLNVALHPSQLYLSLGDLVLFAVLIVLRRRKRYDGQIFLWYVALYAVLRGLLEFTRGDPRGSWLGLSTSQIIASVALLVAVALMLRLRRTAPPLAARRAVAR